MPSEPKMSDREEVKQICDLTHHEWADEYYGLKCENCGEFIPYGCEPWIPFEDDDEPEERWADCETCGGEFWGGGTSCTCENLEYYPDEPYPDEAA